MKLSLGLQILVIQRANGVKCLDGHFPLTHGHSIQFTRLLDSFRHLQRNTLRTFSLCVSTQATRLASCLRSVVRALGRKVSIASYKNMGPCPSAYSLSFKQPATCPARFNIGGRYATFMRKHERSMAVRAYVAK